MIDKDLLVDIWPLDKKGRPLRLQIFWVKGEPLGCQEGICGVGLGDE